VPWINGGAFTFVVVVVALPFKATVVLPSITSHALQLSPQSAMAVMAMLVVWCMLL
jgi:hypothetical protein